MAKRKRRTATDPSIEFEDPLSNYDGPELDDPLVEAMLRDSVTKVEHQPFTAVGPDDLLCDVLTAMDKIHVACTMVVQDGKLLGIFSERDVLNKLVDDYASLSNKPVSEFMTPQPSATYTTDSPSKAMNLMAVHGFRHVPILDVDDNVVGIIGPRRVLRYIKTYSG